MGLLSDPEYGSVKWVKILKKIHRPLCFLCYVGALVWFVMLGNRDFNNETYFSENALLPGLVTNEFNGEQAAKQFLNEFQQELEDKYNEREEMPVSWLVGKMSQLHLETYVHNFTLNYPLGQGQVYRGSNVYGILRGARAGSLEAVVVAAPYRPPASHHKGTAASVALIMAFAQFARLQKYWAKDIIFLVTEHEQLGMQAWLEAYHGLDNDMGTFYKSLGSFWQPDNPSLDFTNFFSTLNFKDYKKCLNPGVLKGRSGSIQAAINLEFHVPNIKYIEVKVEGLNGQLPNLDLVNLVHKLCVKSGIHHSYKNSYSWVRSRSKLDEWKNGVWTMLGMLTAQMAGVPNGNHGVFHRFGIEAVTLEGRAADDPDAPPAARVNALTAASFRRLGVLLESVLRSLNNLLESFHQSYFFYLLASTHRFISIGQYMPSLCLLCVAMLIKALYLWVTIQQDEDDETDNKEDNKVPGDDEREKRKKAKADVPLNINALNIGANYLLMHLLGYTVMNSPVMITQLGVACQLPSEVSVWYGLWFLCAASPLPARLLRVRLTPEELSLLNILVLVELATACLAVGMHNYSLGLVIGVIYTPLALVVGPATAAVGKRKAVWLWTRRVVCLVAHPLAALWVGLALYSRGLFPEEGLLGMASRGTLAAMQATMFAIVDSLIYGNWLFNVVSCVVLPIWLLFWQILCSSVDPANTNTNTSTNTSTNTRARLAATGTQ